MKTKITVLFTLIAAAFISLNAQSIGTGLGVHTIVANSDGTVYTWGYNYYGQLGNGISLTASNVPVAVTTNGVLSGKTITQVAATPFHSIALASNGTVYTWGFNGYGQLGNGNNTNSDVPVAVTTSGVLSGKTITQVAAGEFHSIALASDGTVYAWGYNGYGQLGNGNKTISYVPVGVDGVLSGKTITQVAAGKSHSIALASDGTVYTWGINEFGQLGNGNTEITSNVPVAVNTSGVLSGKTITKVAAGFEYSIALASDGTVYTWGRNEFGQLGNGNTGTDSNVPVAVTTDGVLSGKTITQVAAGANHSITLASDGTMYSWGYNFYGAFGNGNTGINSNVPVAVVTNGVLIGKTITQVAAGYEHSIALASDGTVYTWGRNEYGQLGTGNNINSNVPVAVNQSIIGPLPVELTAFTAEYVFALYPGYPNPFNPSTTIKYSIPTDVSGEMTNVKLIIYDVIGNEVAALINQKQSAGEYEVQFNAKNLPSGIYLSTLQANGNVHTQKLLLIK